MATVRLANQTRRKSKTARKKPTVKAVFVMSDAEVHLRRCLVNSKKIKDQMDDLGLYKWIDGMNLVSGDARSEWEKGIQDRLAQQLGLNR